MKTDQQSLDKLVIAATQNIEEKNYWLDKLSEEPGKNHFPYDYPPKSKYEFNADFETVLFPGDVFSQLMELSRGSDARLFIIMTAALFILLVKYTRNNDITIGTSIYKQATEVEFINTVLALRNRVNGNIAVKELLKQVGQTVFEANKHQNYPIEILLKQLTLPLRQDEDFPLFDIAVLSENIHDKKYLNHINLNMILLFKRTEIGMEGSVEYNSLLYKKSTIKRIVSHFMVLLKEMVFNVEKRIDQVNILSEKEKREILYEFNDTKCEYSRDKTVHQLFEEQVEKTPGNIAVTGGTNGSRGTGASLTYRQLNRKANQLALELRKKGVKPNRFAAVVMDRSVEMVIAVMAILKSGGAYVPLETYLPHARIITCLSSLNVEWVLTNSLQLNKIDKISVELPCLKHIFCLDRVQMPEEALGELFKTKELILKDQIEKNSIEDHENLEPAASATDTAYVIFTSGTTGTPKGVVEMHRPVINIIQWVNKTFNVDISDRLLFVVSLGFDLSVYDIFGILAAGGTVWVAGNNETKSPERLLEIIFEEGITFWDSAPAALQLLVPYLQNLHETGQYPNKSKMRLVFLSGDWIPLKMPEILKQTFPGVRVIGLGGATEATIWSNYFPIEEIDPNWNSIPYGKPIQNAKYYILDGSLNPCPIGVPGDLYIGGECLASCYINDEVLTANKFLDNPFEKGEKIYKTGDWARWFPDGNMEFLGRQDNQVKIRGYRIELGEIESRLLGHADIKEAVVLAQGEIKGDRYLCAYYVADREFPPAQLGEFLSETLPEYMVPSFFLKLQKIPLTTNGKVDRKAFPEPESREGTKKLVAPRDEIENKLSGIWADILGLNKEAIGINFDFFNLGGHSLNATIMVTRIHKELNVKIPLWEVFKMPTIMALSKYIKGAELDRYAAIKPVEKKEYYPLSSAQRRLYVLQQLALNSTAYNVYTVYEAEGEPDREKLKNSFTRLVQRYESMKTSFTVMEEKPVQMIHDNVEFEIEYYLATEDTEDTEDTERKSLDPESCISSFIRPFDLSRPPLLRVGLIKINKQKHLIMVDMHHIVTDWISQRVLINEFTSLYKGGETQPLKIQYKDYSEWQHSKAAEQTLKAQERYWIREFEGEIPHLNLPTDFPRPVLQSFEGGSINFQLSEKETTMLNQLARSEGATIFMVLLAIYNILLSKLSQQDTIIVGSPIAGRRHPDLEPIIGVFVNMMAIKTCVEGDITFVEFLKSIKEKTLETFENQDYQYEDLVEKVALERDTSRNPLFDVGFVLENSYEPSKFSSGQGVEGLKIKPYAYENKTSKFDILMYAIEGQEKLQFDCQYCIKLFKKETIVRFINFYKRIISSFSKNPARKISEIVILTEEEKHSLLYEFNDTKAGYPEEKVLQQLFQEQAEKNPHTPALISSNHKDGMSYRELNEQANQLARLLRSRGVTADTIVGVLAHPSIESIIAILAVLKAGGAFLPIEPDYPESRKLYMIKDSALKILLIQENLLEGSTFLYQLISRENVLCIDNGAGEWQEKSNLATKNQPGDTAYIIYTSGSTGKPKGVLVRHQSVVNYIWWGIKKYLRNDRLNFPLYTSLSFDLTVTSIFTPLVSGNSIIVYEGESGDSLIEKIIQDKQVGVVKLTPSHLKLILGKRDESFQDSLPGEKIVSAVKRLIVGGEALETKVAGRIVELFYEEPEIYNEYGPTETTVGCMIYRFDQEKDNRKAVPIGIPIANTGIYLLDRNLNPVPRGVVGEIYIGGDGVARGYLNRPELTAEKFNHDFWDYQDYQDGYHRSHRSYKSYITYRSYRTGDRARFLPGGNIEFLGRVDHQVKIRGFRIELEEIQDKLMGYKSHKPLNISDRKVEDIELKKILRCKKCLLPVSYPNIHFDENGVCNVCLEYEKYKKEIDPYFKSKEDFQQLVENTRKTKLGDYDCLLLFSGGKDSSFVLYQLIDMGLSVLTFTFDNGYISEAAFANIKRITSELQVENIVCNVENMNKVFVESLNVNHNVCQGCWNALNTMGAKIAHDKGINLVISGLSRGQIFEMRLESLFQRGIFDEEEIEKNLLLFRKTFHSRSNKFVRLLGVELDGNVVGQINFVDFFRYFNTPVVKIREYLEEKGWVQPVDTGFCSSNCIINDVGIYVHLKEKGYHFYAPQLSWDCRLGSITREQGMKEIGFESELHQVDEVLKEIGYYNSPIKDAIIIDKEDEDGDLHLVAYIVSEEELTVPEIREYLSRELPEYMIPSHFVQLDEIPLTPNGKVDRKALESSGSLLSSGIEYVPPESEMEKIIAEAWMKTLKLDKVGIYDNFFDLGGNSMHIIKLNSKLKQEIGKDIPMVEMFKYPTINSLSQYLSREKKSLANTDKRIEESVNLIGEAMQLLAGGENE